MSTLSRIRLLLVQKSILISSLDTLIDVAMLKARTQRESTATFRTQTEKTRQQDQATTKDILRGRDERLETAIENIDNEIIKLAAEYADEALDVGPCEARDWKVEIGDLFDVALSKKATNGHVLKKTREQVLFLAEKWVALGQVSGAL